MLMDPRALGRDPRPLGRDPWAVGRDPWIVGRDPRGVFGRDLRALMFWLTEVSTEVRECLSEY